MNTTKKKLYKRNQYLFYEAEKESYAPEQTRTADLVVTSHVTCS